MRCGMFALFAALLFSSAMPSPTAAKTYGTTGFHIDWWHNESGIKGYQYHIPIEAGGDLGALSYKVLTAYAYNYFKVGDGSSFDLDGLVDTRLNLAYQILDRLPVDLLLALDLNLPTGKTKLQRAEALVISEPDKVTITRMGEGLNINPSLILLKQWRAFMVSVGAGYIWRGDYDPLEEFQDYDPGDALNLTAEIGCNFTPQWLARLFGSYTRFGKDQWQDRDYFQAGAVSILGASLGYLRSQWDLTASLQVILRDKDKDTDLSGTLVTDTNRYYGDEWIGQLRGNYQISDRLSLGALVQYLTIGANDYTAAAWYLSRREKMLGGVELVYRPAAHWETGLKVNLYRMQVHDNPFNTYPNEDFDGGAAALWITARY